MNELEELNRLVDNFNKGCGPLIDWVRRHRNDPFFETIDGRHILEHTSMIAEGGSLLNLKMAIILLENVILERKVGGNGEEP